MLIYPIRAPATVTRNFFVRLAIYVDGQHGASDIIALFRPTTGEPLLAVDNGMVVSNNWDGQSGWYVQLDTDSGWRAGYRHLRERSPMPVGTRVAQGQVLGYADSTGNVTGPHLHFDLWARQQRSPEAYLSSIGWWKHDPEVWLNKETTPTPTPEPTPPAPPDEEDFLAKLTEAEQKEVLTRLRNIDKQDDAWWSAGPAINALRDALLEWKVGPGDSYDDRYVGKDTREELVQRLRLATRLLERGVPGRFVKREGTEEIWMLAVTANRLVRLRLPGPMVLGFLGGHPGAVQAVSSVWLDKLPEGTAVPGIT